MAINTRARKVLGQVVTLHYSTCEPVGSALISRTRVVPFSPATIRNVMMRLEDWGYLSQPNTSAGRLPTDMGYRAYVNDISLNREPLNGEERQLLSRRISQSPSVPMLLKNLADFIQEKTNLVAFHLPFRHSGIRLKQVHFERVDRETIFVLWVARGGQIFQTLLRIDENMVDRTMMERIENFINNAYRDRFLMEMEQSLLSRSLASGRQDLLLVRSALVISALANEASQLDNIMFQGVSGLLEMPEFQRIQDVKILLNLLEQKSKIKQLVELSLANAKEWIFFFIGREMEDPDLANLTAILAKIHNREDCLGCVGVLGPKRMPYLRSLQILSSAREQIAAQPL